MSAAWIAIVFSFWLPFRAARVYAKHDPFHYTILCLFGLVWAFLFPFWFRDQLYVFGVYSGFLLTLVGCLLRKMPAADKKPLVPLTWTLRLAVIVLAFGVYGSINGYQSSHVSNLALQPQQAGLVAAIALDILGFITVALSLRLTSHWIDIPFLLLTGVYVVVEVWFGLSVFKVCESPGHVGPYFRVAFAVLKAAYTSIVVALIIGRCRTAEDAALPFHEKILKFVH